MWAVVKTVKTYDEYFCMRVTAPLRQSSFTQGGKAYSSRLGYDFRGPRLLTARAAEAEEQRIRGSNCRPGPLGFRRVMARVLEA